MLVRKAVVVVSYRRLVVLVLPGIYWRLLWLLLRIWVLDQIVRWIDLLGCLRLRALMILGDGVLPRLLWSLMRFLGILTCRLKVFTHVLEALLRLSRLLLVTCCLLLWLLRRRFLDKLMWLILHIVELKMIVMGKRLRSYHSRVLIFDLKPFLSRLIFINFVNLNYSSVSIATLLWSFFRGALILFLRVWLPVTLVATRAGLLFVLFGHHLLLMRVAWWHKSRLVRHESSWMHPIVGHHTTVGARGTIIHHIHRILVVLVLRIGVLVVWLLHGCALLRHLLTLHRRIHVRSTHWVMWAGTILHLITEILRWGSMTVLRYLLLAEGAGAHRWTMHGIHPGVWMARVELIRWIHLLLVRRLVHTWLELWWHIRWLMLMSHTHRDTVRVIHRRLLNLFLDFLVRSGYVWARIAIFNHILLWRHLLGLVGQRLLIHQVIIRVLLLLLAFDLIVVVGDSVDVECLRILVSQGLLRWRSLHRALTLLPLAGTFWLLLVLYARVL